MTGPAAMVTREHQQRGCKVAHRAAEGRRRAQTADSATLDEQCHPRKIFVGGLAHKTTTQQLRDHFGRYGPIVDSVVLVWPDGRSRGFGYVTFSDVAHASAALRISHEVGGRQVDVKRAVPGTNKIFVGGLPQNTAATELRAYFEYFGVVSDAVVMIDPATTRSRGFGFVCFSPGPEGGAVVQTVLAQYQGHRIRGKWIEVKTAAPPHKLCGKDAFSHEAGMPPGLEIGTPLSSPGGSVALTASDFQLPASKPYSQHKPLSASAPAYEPRKVALPVTSTATMDAAMAAMGAPPGLAHKQSHMFAAAAAPGSATSWGAEATFENNSLSNSLQKSLEQLLRQRSSRLECEKVESTSKDADVKGMETMANPQSPCKVDRHGG